MPQKAKVAKVATVAPNQYHLSGENISVTYYPGGAGPILENRGALTLFYAEGTDGRAFGSKQVEKEQVPNLGTIVRVELLVVPDLGLTTFSLVVPIVNLPDGENSSASISTFGVKTFHRLYLGDKLPVLGQQEVYTVVPLSGDTRVGPLPL